MSELTENQKKELIKIEKLEKKYLDKYFYFLKFVEDELLLGFQTKYKIKDDWYTKWNPNEEGKGISDFSTGAERIVYSLLNGKGIGQPNSAPIGADLFFEVEDAFIHIDLKTVQTRNIDDYAGDIFVGNNQNSYIGNLDVKNDEKIYDEACLPHYYIFKEGGIKRKKPCLTYFITILYEEINLEILNINILCMPNGSLYPVYGKKVLKAGKVLYPIGNPKRETHAKSIRFNWKDNLDFELLNTKSRRLKVAYLNKTMDDALQKRLSLIMNLEKEQNTE